MCPAFARQCGRAYQQNLAGGTFRRIAVLCRQRWPWVGFLGQSVRLDTPPV